MLIKSDRCPFDHKVLSLSLQTGVLLVISNAPLLDPFLAQEIHLLCFYLLYESLELQNLAIPTAL